MLTNKLKQRLFFTVCVQLNFKRPKISQKVFYLVFSICVIDHLGVDITLRYAAVAQAVRWQPKQMKKC